MPEASSEIARTRPVKSPAQTLIDNVTFNATTTTATSSSVDALHYSKFLLFVDKDVAGTPTTIEIQVQMSHDGINWIHYTRGPFGYLAWEDTAGSEDEGIDGEVIPRYIRVHVIAIGTTAVNTFTLTVSIQLMS